MRFASRPNDTEFDDPICHGLERGYRVIRNRALRSSLYEQSPSLLHLRTNRLDEVDRLFLINPIENRAERIQHHSHRAALRLGDKGCDLNIQLRKVRWILDSPL